MHRRDSQSVSSCQHLPFRATLTPRTMLLTGSSCLDAFEPKCVNINWLCSQQDDKCPPNSISIVDRDASWGGHTAALLWGHGNATTTDSRALVSQYWDGDTRGIKVLGERYEQDKWTSNGQDKWTSTILSLGNCHCVDGHWTSVSDFEESLSSWSQFQLEAGWQKLCGGTRGPRRKVWTRTKILSPNIRRMSIFEPIIRRLKNNISNGTKCKISFKFVG